MLRAGRVSGRPRAIEGGAVAGDPGCTAGVHLGRGRQLNGRATVAKLPAGQVHGQGCEIDDADGLVGVVPFVAIIEYGIDQDAS